MYITLISVAIEWNDLCYANGYLTIEISNAGRIIGGLMAKTVIGYGMQGQLAFGKKTA